MSARCPRCDGAGLVLLETDGRTATTYCLLCAEELTCILPAHAARVAADVAAAKAEKWVGRGRPRRARGPLFEAGVATLHDLPLEQLERIAGRRG